MFSIDSRELFVNSAKALPIDCEEIYIKKKAKKVARKVGRFSPVTLGKELRRKMSKK